MLIAVFPEKNMFMLAAQLTLFIYFLAIGLWKVVFNVCYVLLHFNKALIRLNTDNKSAFTVVIVSDIYQLKTADLGCTFFMQSIAQQKNFLFKLSVFLNCI